MTKFTCDACPGGRKEPCVIGDRGEHDCKPQRCPYGVGDIKPNWRKVEPADKSKIESEPGRFSRIDDNAIPPSRVEPSDVPTRLSAAFDFHHENGGYCSISFECPGCKEKDVELLCIRADLKSAEDDFKELRKAKDVEIAELRDSVRVLQNLDKIKTRRYGEAVTKLKEELLRNSESIDTLDDLVGKYRDRAQEWEKTAGEISDRSARQAGEIDDLKVMLADKHIAGMSDSSGAKGRKEMTKEEIAGLRKKCEDGTFPTGKIMTLIGAVEKLRQDNDELWETLEAVEICHECNRSRNMDRDIRDDGKCDCGRFARSG